MSLRPVWAATIVLVACGDAAAPSPSCDVRAVPSEGTRLEIKFAEPLRVRGCSLNDLQSETGASLGSIRAAFEALPSVDLQPMFGPRAQIERLMQEAESISGEPPVDLLSWYYLWVAPGVDAAEAVEELRARPDIEFASVSSVVVPPPPGSVPRLFRVLESPQLTPEQQSRLDAIRSRVTTADVHVGELADEPQTLLQPGTTVAIDVSPALTFVARGAEARTNDGSGLSWAGFVLGEYGTVQLVLTDLGATASLLAPPELYRFEPVGGRLHALIRAGVFPPD